MDASKFDFILVENSSPVKKVAGEKEDAHMASNDKTSIELAYAALTEQFVMELGPPTE